MVIPPLTGNPLYWVYLKTLLYYWVDDYCMAKMGVWTPAPVWVKGSWPSSAHYTHHVPSSTITIITTTTTITGIIISSILTTTTTIITSNQKHHHHHCHRHLATATTPSRYLSTLHASWTQTHDHMSKNPSALRIRRLVLKIMNPPIWRRGLHSTLVEYVLTSAGCF